MISKIVFSIFILLFNSLLGLSQERTIEASVLLKAESHSCIGEMHNQALKEAKLKALADTFGTVVQQGVQTTVGSGAQGVKSESVIDTQVKGEWVKTISEELEWILRKEPVGKKQEQVLYLKAYVKGKARALETSHVDIIAKTLNCDDDIECETTFFKNEEPVYLYLRSAKKGYVNIFLNEDDEVYRLLPYQTMEQEAIKIQADKDYFLLSASANTLEGVEAMDVDEYYLENGHLAQKFYQIYVVFSEKEFDKPHLDTSQEGVKFIRKKKFQKWLLKNKRFNPYFQESMIPVTVGNQ